MNTSPSQIVRQLLADANVVSIAATTAGKTAVWPCYIAAMPDGDAVSDDCVAVYDIPGIKQGRQMEGTVLERFAIQVKVRARNYMVGWQKMAAIVDALDDVYFADVQASTAYAYRVQAIMRGVPLSIGPEVGTKRRFLFTLNCNFTADENP